MSPPLFTFAFILCVLVVVVVVGATMAKDKLLAVTILYRHGERTPVVFYPNDPHKDKKEVWNAEPGALTNVGKEQMYSLGKWFRKRYSSFLSATYKQEEIYVRSSNKDRCIMSAAANLAGLFPPVDRDVWNPELPWQPIPIHSVPEKYDQILYYFEACPRYLRLFWEFATTTTEKYKDLLNYISTHAGANMSLVEAMYLYDTLKLEEEKNLVLPNWTSRVYPDQLKKLHEEYYLAQISTPLITKIGCGRFFNELKNHFTTLKPKMKIFSGHDVNIFVITAALKLGNTFDIPVSAALLFELYENDEGQRNVRIYYKKGDSVDEVAKYDQKNFSEFVRQLSTDEDEYSSICL